tara:strand:- start:82 stop:708 length:627 start_codon:yes stop_codon:yes gene_type:complete
MEKKKNLLNNINSEFLFPTQIATGHIKDFSKYQQGLLDWIYDYKERNPGIAKISNKRGWQSLSKDVFLDKGFDPFKDLIVKCMDQLSKEFHVFKRLDLVQMWLNINGPFSYNVSHRHSGSDLSGVLWIKQTPESGRFVFDNMDVGYRDAMLLYGMDREYLEQKKMPLEYVPQYADGTMILFPSGFTHRVEINETTEDRVSLSFNIKII